MITSAKTLREHIPSFRIEYEKLIDIWERYISHTIEESVKSGDMRVGKPLKISFPFKRYVDTNTMEQQVTFLFLKDINQQPLTLSMNGEADFFCILGKIILADVKSAGWDITATPDWKILEPSYLISMPDVYYSEYNDKLYSL